MQTRSFLSLIFATAVLAGCASVEQPKGSSKGYSSVRFMRAKATLDPPEFIDDSEQANRLIQAAITDQFRANGIEFGGEDADLAVGYLLIVQNNASTGMVNDYFGYGRDSLEISELAHKRGVLEGNRPDYFEAGAIVIDLVDAKTNKLVYRNFAKRDLLENPSEAQRRQRINAAVAEALGPFFR